jgi:hypothetical protein
MRDVALEDVLDEIDPELDLTLEGEDDLAALEPPPRPASRPAPIPRAPSELGFWLVMAAGALAVIAAVILWVWMMGA